MLVVIHSGQTGVERGAHKAAIATGFQLAGFMPLDGRDETGPIPDDVAQHLTPCSDRGPRPAVRANIQLASGVLLVVPESKQFATYTAMAATLTAVRRMPVPYLICDLTTPPEEVSRFVLGLPETSGSVRLMVTGPRATRWHKGESLAFRLVAGLGM